ncbi:MAG TPA: acyl-CoA carboxylase subunit beta, partial [Isosphaeraceae bacterium]|nr:acyl-CoA carboxylase subunit beta [Isosphaeraceae bacterium]
MSTETKKSMEQLVEDLRTKKEQLRQGGGPDRLAKQKEEGKLTARERIDALVDPGSFEEIGLFAQHRQTLFGMAGKEVPADGVVTGAGSVGGRLIHLASQDFTVLGGSAGEVHSHKVADVMELALKNGSPFVLINDSGGARVQEGIDSLSGYGRVFHTNVMLSGAVPQISLICGPCAGGASYSPALTDFIIQTRQARMFITGPQVIKQVTGEQITAEALGGPDAHMTHSGVIHFIAEDDQEALHICRRLLSFLPQNNLEEPHRLPAEEHVDPNPELNKIVPVEPKQSYDMHDVIHHVVDRGDFLEVHAGFAMNILVGFARILGRTIGIIANQPAVLSGALDINASIKASRFIRFCNAFNISLVTFVDVPGFLPGVQQEYGGIIRNGAKL